jgi:MFS family permease
VPPLLLGKSKFVRSTAYPIAALTIRMTAQLRLNLNNRYNIITLLFFIPYVLFQPPATVLMRKIGPRIFLTTIVVLWGGVMIGMGFAKNWETLAGLRVALGVLEAGFFPGCVYLL